MPTLRRARAVPVGNKTPRTKDTSRTREDRIGERITPQPNGCWTYDGAHNPGGYAVNGTTVHRLVYETLVGPIPDGHHLHHHCGNRGCVRPSHLEPSTPAEHAAVHAELRRAS